MFLLHVLSTFSSLVFFLAGKEVPMIQESYKTLSTKKHSQFHLVSFILLMPVTLVVGRFWSLIVVYGIIYESRLLQN